MKRLEYLDLITKVLNAMVDLFPTRLEQFPIKEVYFEVNLFKSNREISSLEGARLEREAERLF